MRFTLRPQILLRDILPRVLADVVFLCASLFLGFLTYFFAPAFWWNHFPSESQLRGAFNVLYLENVVFLVSLGILIFALFGFYTHTRAYQHRYKVLIIINAVSLTFLVEVLLYSYVLRLDAVPRGAMLLAWIFALMMITGSRMVKDYFIKSFSVSRKSRPGIRETRKVLVIGGAGYIGSVLSRQLLEAGYKVRVLDSLMFGDSSTLDLVRHPNFELLHADFRHVESMVKAMDGMDAVIHLAAIVGDPACTIKTDLTTEINYLATRMLVEVAKGAGVNRLLFASTCSVYGASDFLMDERSAPHPISLYAQTKLDCEKVILESESPSLHPTCLRLSTVFGPSPRPRFDLVVNLLVARAIQDKKITIFNHDQWRPFIHVEDVARAFVRALQSPPSTVSGEIFNVGSYHLNYSLGQVAEKIREQIPEVQIEYKENPDKRNYRVSFDKIHSYLGYVCTKGIDEGIEEIKKLIETGQVDDYRDKIFSNYEFLLTAGNDLLKSESSVQLFTALEAADATSLTAVPPVYVEQLAS